MTYDPCGLVTDATNAGLLDQKRRVVTSGTVKNYRRERHSVVVIILGISYSTLDRGVNPSGKVSSDDRCHFFRPLDATETRLQEETYAFVDLPEYRLA